MKIVFISNFFNHHQQPVADELYKLTNGDYYFIELQKMPESFIKSGFPKLDRQYVVRAWQNIQTKSLADKLILESDVVVYGGIQNYELLVPRQKMNKITFEYGERWFKKGLLNFLSPNLWKWWIYNKFLYKTAPKGRLCAGAYCKKDVNLLGLYKNKCYKWGYFPPILGSGPRNAVSDNEVVKIIWVARFIKWKHPEIPVKLAAFLKKNGFKFELNMYGGGVLEPKVKEYIVRDGVEDCVVLHGNVNNEQIQKAMSDSDIFLLTSDRNEGWGAVVNEAMSNGCCVVANEKVGSVPYLIDDNVTGRVYSNFKQLCDIMSGLMKNKQVIKQLGDNGYNKIVQEWSPQKAANNLYRLFDSVLNGSDSGLTSGPAYLDE